MNAKEFEKLTITGVLPSLRGSRRGRDGVTKPSSTLVRSKRPGGLLWILRRLFGRRASSAGDADDLL